MNEKDIKVIAKIIKKHKFVCRSKSNEVTGIDMGIIDELADYCEKEDKKAIKEVGNVMGTIVLPLFNRKQFLKWCGVDEK